MVGICGCLGSIGCFLIAGPFNMCCCIPAITGGFLGSIIGAIGDLAAIIMTMCGGMGHELQMSKGMEMIRIG